MQNGQQPKRLLAVNLNYLGDALFTTPALATLRARFPEATLDVVAGGRAEMLLRGNPHIDRLLIRPPRGGMARASMLARTLRERGSTAGYGEALLEDFGRDLLKAAALRDWFYAPGFARRMIGYCRRSAALRRILADLVLGEQGYRGLRRRLLGTAPRFLLESALSPILPAA